MSKTQRKNDELGNRFMVVARDYEGKLIASKHIWELNSDEAADVLWNELEPWQLEKLDVITVYQTTNYK